MATSFSSTVRVYAIQLHAASGLVSTISAARMIRDDQADFALCGAGDAVTELVYAAFARMGVLADGDDPKLYVSRLMSTAMDL